MPPTSSERTPRAVAFLALLLLVAAPLLFGGVVRRIGIHHGAPDNIWHPDVSKQVWVLRLHADDNLDMKRVFRGDTEMTLYPYGTAILLSHAVRLWEDIAGPPPTRPSHWDWAVRMRKLASAFALLGAVCAVFALRKPLGFVPTLLVALLLVLEPLNAELSHYAMNDVPLASVLLMIWFCASRVPSEPTRLPVFSILGGALLGIGFGIKYQAVLGGVMLLAAWLLARPGRSWPSLLGAALAAGAAAVLGALLTTPMLAQYPLYFFEQLPSFLKWQSNITMQEYVFTEKLGRNVAHLARILVQDGAWLLLPLAAIGAAGLRDRALPRELRALLVSGLSLAVVLVLATVCSRDFVRANDALPLFGILAVLAGVGVARCAPAGGFGWNARLAAPGLALVALAWFATVAFQDSLALMRPDTRELARDWCRKNVKPGEIVRREAYTLPLGMDGVTEREHKTFGDGRAGRDLLLGNYDYLITSTFAHSRLFNPLLPYHDEDAQQVYPWITNSNDLVAEFSDRAMHHAHPGVAIYRKRAAAPAAAAPSDTPSK